LKKLHSLKALGALTLLLVLAVSCEEVGYEPVVKLSVDKEELELNVGEEGEINITVVKSSGISDMYELDWDFDDDFIEVTLEEIDEELTPFPKMVYITKSSIITFYVKAIAAGETPIIFYLSNPFSQVENEDEEEILECTCTVTVN